VVSAWVPETHIKTMPVQYGEAGTYDESKRGTPTATALKEQEVIVNPGHNSEIHQVHKDTGKSPNSWTWEPKKLAASEDLEKIKAYHGTAREFDKFKTPKKSGPVLNYGTGIYASTDPKEAADYAGPQVSRRDADAAAYDAMRSDKKFNKKLDQHATHYGLKHSRDYDHPNYDKFNAEVLKPHEENYLSEKLGMAPHVKRVDMDIKNPFDIHNIDHAK